LIGAAERRATLNDIVAALKRRKYPYGEGKFYILVPLE
jgi:hypothetical protein